MPADSKMGKKLENNTRSVILQNKNKKSENLKTVSNYYCFLRMFFNGLVAPQ